MKERDTYHIDGEDIRWAKLQAALLQCFVVSDQLVSRHENIVFKADDMAEVEPIIEAFGKGLITNKEALEVLPSFIDPSLN